MTTPNGPSARSDFERWSALGGALFAVLFVVGVILANSGVPDFNAAPAKVIAYYSKSGNRDQQFFAWIVSMLGVLSFLVFVVGLRQRVRRIDGEGMLTAFVALGGVFFAALAAAGISVETGILTMSDDTYHHEVYPDLIHGARDAAYTITAAGGIGAGLMIIAATIAWRRAGAIAPWVFWLSIIAGVLTLGIVAFLPYFVFLLWMLIAGIVLFVRGGGATS